MSGAADLKLETLRLEQEGRVLVARVDDPPYNFMTARMQRDLDALTRAVDDDVSVGAVIVSAHADSLREEVHGYGEGNKRPEEFLDAFGSFIKQNLNTLPALLVVTQRPRDLTRAQLRELRMLLDEQGFSELALRTAWKDKTNADIAASIIGFVRQSALGDPLVPYEERVDRAMKKLLASKKWTEPQRKWLDRIGKQLKVETIVDHEALNDGEFKNQGGGFDRLNKQFDGKLDDIVGGLRESIWTETG